MVPGLDRRDDAAAEERRAARHAYFGAEALDRSKFGERVRKPVAALEPQVVVADAECDASKGCRAELERLADLVQPRRHVAGEDQAVALERVSRAHGVQPRHILRVVDMNIGDGPEPGQRRRRIRI